MLNEFTLIEPNPTVRFRQFGTGSFDVLVVFYAMTPNMDDFLVLQEEVNYSILKILKTNEVHFSSPSTTLVMKQEKDQL